jgi:signal transduction histidine kinase
MFPKEPVAHRSEEQTLEHMTISQSPILLFILTAAAIFITETVVMLFLSLLPPFSTWVQALIDAILLILLLFPMLYFFMFRPMRLHSTELFKTYGQLKAQITERLEAEAALRESEKQLRYLSSQLLTAQENERRRVSRELHEELGQTLAFLKLRLRFVEKNLQKDQRELREECENNLRYIDQVIENIRRLSRDLSPSILEDFGLSAALLRLVNNLSKDYKIKTSIHLMDIDHLFSQEAQIIIYRVFQEALTNIGKHAQASYLSVVINEQNSNVSFIVEDNGKGFDVERTIMQNGAGRGFGLATMDERARMLGGSLDVWSQEGKGTRITLTIPKKKTGMME